MQNSMTVAGLTGEHLNNSQVFNSDVTLDRDASPTSYTSSFEFSDQSSCLSPNFLYHKDPAERSSSLSGNSPILGSTPSSSSVNYSSAFHPFLSPPCSYTWPLLGKYTARDSLSVQSDQIQHNQMQFTDSSVFQGRFEVNSFSCRAKTSTALADVQAVIAVDNSGKGKSKTARIRHSSKNFDCNSSDNADLKVKHEIKLRRKKKAVEVKDETYWKKREKNNLAAKKSRETRRRQELSTQQRAASLEIKNTQLLLELSCLRQENRKLKSFLSVYALQ